MPSGLQRFPVLLASLCLSLAAFAARSARAQTATPPPDPPADADLGAIGAWMERWLPVVGAASYAAIGNTGDFFAHASDSVTSVRLNGCTLVLEELAVSTVRGETFRRRLAIHVPLKQVDTTAVQPKIRRAGMLLDRPGVMLTGQMVVPLRNQLRTDFITVVPRDPAGRDTVVAEHLVPFPFAVVPAERSARAIRRAAGLCSAKTDRQEDRRPYGEQTVFGS
jgi:hypothetical protein